MILGIDASNIRAGGGVTHLVELLRAANPSEHGFEKVIVWGGKSTLDKIDDRDWLNKVNDPMLDRSLPYRVFWQRFKLKKLAEQVGCSVLFVPGGFDLSGFKIVVLMSQNLIPFDYSEIFKLKRIAAVIRLLILRNIQIYSFKRANGIVFLTHYAKKIVLNITGLLKAHCVIIPHGISSKFQIQPRPLLSSDNYNNCNPYKILYVSSIDLYKHQSEVVEAVSQLRISGVPITLDLIGPLLGGMKKLKKTICRVDREGSFIKYRGFVPHEALNKYYKSSDIMVFASSCESFGMILLEGMSAGMPIACSNMSSMFEILGDAGVYFNPIKPEEIASAIFSLIESPLFREKNANKAFDRSLFYSWDTCSKHTFDFIFNVSNEYKYK